MSLKDKYREAAEAAKAAFTSSATGAASSNAGQQGDVPAPAVKDDNIPDEAVVAQPANTPKEVEPPRVEVPPFVDLDGIAVLPPVAPQETPVTKDTSELDALRAEIAELRAMSSKKEPTTEPAKPAYEPIDVTAMADAIDKQIGSISEDLLDPEIRAALSNAFVKPMMDIISKQQQALDSLTSSVDTKFSDLADVPKQLQDFKTKAEEKEYFRRVNTTLQAADKDFSQVLNSPDFHDYIKKDPIFKHSTQLQPGDYIYRAYVSGDTNALIGLIRDYRDSKENLGDTASVSSKGAASTPKTVAIDDESRYEAISELGRQYRSGDITRTAYIEQLSNLRKNK